MIRLLAAAVAILFFCSAADAQNSRASAHITSATTTTVVSGTSGLTIQIFNGSLCVDAGGARTGLTIQDSAGTNLVGANVKYVLDPNSCLWLPAKLRGGGTPAPYFNPTAAGNGLQVVTDAAGPVQVYFEVAR